MSPVSGAAYPLVDQPRGGWRRRVVRVEVDAHRRRPGHLGRPGDHLTGQRRTVAAADRPVGRRRVDRADELGRSATVKAVRTGASWDLVDHDPVVLLAGEDVRRALGVLV